MDAAGRANFLIGVAAALTAFAVTEGLWAMSPHGGWTNLIFLLFPAPAMDECARLIAVFALLARPRPGAFAAGFAPSASLGVLVMGLAEGGEALSLGIAFVLSLTLQALLSFGAFAMAARKAPPFLIFCALTLIHGGSNGGLIALSGVTGRIGFFTAELVLAALFSYGAYMLARQMPSAAKIG